MTVVVNSLLYEADLLRFTLTLEGNIIDNINTTIDKSLFGKEILEN